MSTQEELEKLADEIGKAGSETDTATNTLAKGMVDGLKELIAMVKAKPVAPPPPPAHAPPKDDEEKKNEKDEDTDEKAKPADKPEAGDGQAGYDDMGKAVEGEEFVDATEFVLALQRDVADLTKMVKASQAQSDALSKAIESLAADNARLASALANTLAPMAKGVMDLRDSILRIPAPAVGDTSMDRARARHGVEPPVAVDGLPRVQLLKSLQKRIITEDQLNEYKASGQFVEDETLNKTITEQVKAA